MYGHLRVRKEGKRRKTAKSSFVQSVIWRSSIFLVTPNSLWLAPLSSLCSFSLIVWHIKGVTASWIKASAAHSVLYCSISLCRHTRDSHWHREKRGRRRGGGGRGGGVGDEEYRSRKREDDRSVKDNRCVKGVFYSDKSFERFRKGAAESENTDCSLV